MSNDYGAEHQRLRTYWKQQINQGRNPPCSRCPYSITPHDKWDLDHNDNGIGYRGPAHQDCNRRAGAIKKNRMYAQKPQRHPRATRNW